MSRRTSEANKAIDVAWKNELELVRDGKGTRDWTREQQQDILDRGKAYDNNGKAFEGHHMKSVEEYPEYQGNAENIQFLTRTEHYAAHDGNFQNPTNGYYRPETGETEPFGKDELQPVQPRELTSPIMTREEAQGEKRESFQDDVKNSSIEDGETGKKTEGFASDLKGANADRSPQANQADAFAQDVKDSNRGKAAAQSSGEISSENKSAAQTVAHGR